jgi:hypothetical protein
MCEHNLNGICFDPARKAKGLVAIKCDMCPKQNFVEAPDPEKEYIHPLFR